MMELGSGGIPYRGKSTAEQHIGRGSEKYSKGEG